MKTIKRYYVIDKLWCNTDTEITPEFLEDIAFFRSRATAEKFLKIHSDSYDANIFEVSFKVRKLGGGNGKK